jgi:hypothetical protein
MNDSTERGISRFAYLWEERRFEEFARGVIWWFHPPEGRNQLEFAKDVMARLTDVMGDDEFGLWLDRFNWGPAMPKTPDNMVIAEARKWVASFGAAGPPRRSMSIRSDAETPAVAEVKPHDKKKPKGGRAALLDRIKGSPVWAELKPREREFLAAGVLNHGPKIFVSVPKWIEEVRAERVRLGDKRTSGLSRATAFRALGGLVEKGVFVHEPRQTSHGRKTTSVYTLAPWVRVAQEESIAA